MKRAFLLSLCFIALLRVASAQIYTPTRWDISLRTAGSGDTMTVVARATIDDGWHVYATQLASGGPQPTTIAFDRAEGVTPVGTLTATDGTLVTRHDATFGMELAFYEHTVTLEQRVVVRGDYVLEGYVRYMACNDETCTPPTTAEFAFRRGDSVESAPDVAAASGDSDNSQFSILNSQLPSAPAHSWWYILLAGFLGGLVALVTPCVWPMIPMTVSFFLKRTKDRRKSVRDAWTYGLSIVVIYVLLGLVVTAIFGAQQLNDLATSAVFNLIFFALLVLFAVSLLGAFELTLPASWTTRLDQRADRATGLASIFLMAFTLCLVSFSCTAPIVGTLLVEAATGGSWLYPLVGMTGFGLALALPFGLFALFPSLLASAPRSGSWMNRVKVVLGFLELALSLKFLSVADLAYGWGILPRETFLSLWIVIFALMGLYLLGVFRLPHDDEPAGGGRISVVSLLLALVSLSFSVYMLPGLWGAPCKAVAAFAPPLSTQDFRLGDVSVEAEYHDLDAAMAAARASGKPVLVDFSGYGCVNCRKMEASVWTAPEVRAIIERDYVLVSLMVDDKTSLPAPVVVEENGRQVKLRTVGDRWSYLQRTRFGANAQPYYILLAPDGRQLAPAYGYDENVAPFVRFLNNGLEAMR